MCGNFEIKVGIDTSKIDSIQKLMTANEYRRHKEENLVRSRIGTLQWFATLTRPDLCIDIWRALSYLNKERDTEILKIVNRIIEKFEKSRFHFHKITPLSDDIEKEVYGDASFEREEIRNRSQKRQHKE